MVLPAARSIFPSLALLTLGIVAAPALAQPLPPQIHTVAGRGGCSGLETSGGPCDNVSATSVPIGEARSVAFLSDGEFVYVDAADDLVREVTISGTVLTIAGNGTTQDAPDGTVAVNSGLNGPVAVTAAPGGGFLITEYNGAVVRKVSPGSPGAATISTVAGTGTPGYSGDGGPATAAQLDYPSDTEVTSDGSLLIADTYNNRIRLITPDGNITTLIGGGPCDDAASDCDGMAASGVAIHRPVSVSPVQGGSGGFLFAEYDNDTVRAVSQLSSAGTFSTVAGVGGQAGYNGDGGPATSAELNHPEAVTSLPGGGFLIADTNNERIRAVSPSGTITTIAGNGAASFAGDGGAATDASFQKPEDVVPTSDGGYLVADGNDGAIRRITNAPTTTIALNPPTPKGKNGWYIATVQAIVTAAGAKTTNCELDPVSAPTVYDEITSGCPYIGSAGDYISGDGMHTIYAASVNSYGDKETPVSLTFKIDTTVPTLNCGKPPTFNVGTKGAEVVASVIDNVSGPVAAQVSAPAATRIPGHHTVQLSGADQAGNIGQANCRYTVRAARLRPTPQLHGRFVAAGSKTNVTDLVVDDVTPHEMVDVRCRGAGCPFKSATNVTGRRCGKKPCQAEGSHRRSRRGAVQLAPLFVGTGLGNGVHLWVTVTKPGAIGRMWLVTLHRGKPPSHTVDCLVPGSSSRLTGC